MNIESAREFALSLHECVEETFPFDEETLVFKICGKMFLVLFLEKPDLMVTKIDPDKGEELRATHSGIEEAWHFNKRHWIQTYLSNTEAELVKELITDSFSLVVAKLPRRLRDNL